MDWLPYDSVCLSSGFLQGWRSGGWIATFPSPILPSRWRSTSMENGLKSLAVEWWSSSLSIQVGKNPVLHLQVSWRTCLVSCDPICIITYSCVTRGSIPNLSKNARETHILQMCLIFGYPPRQLLAASFGLRILYSLGVLGESFVIAPKAFIYVSHECSLSSQLFKNKAHI